MASRIFKDSLVVGVTLEEIRCGIVTVANKLNEERVINGIKGFATVYVSSLLKEPAPLVGISFFVQYSDHDYDVPKQINDALQRVTRAARDNNVFYLRRDPYCA